MKSLVFWGVAPAVLAAVCGSVTSANADQYSVVARVGERSPVGTSTYMRFTNYAGAEPPIITGQGRIAFRGDLTGGGLTTASNSGVFYADPQGEPSVIAQKGTSFLDHNGNTVSFYSFTGLQAGNSDEVAFAAASSGSGVTSSNSRTWWCYDGTRRVLVAREGTGSFGTISETLVQSAPAENPDLMSFKATVPGAPNSFRYWLPGDANPIGGVGMSAPGCGSAVFTTALKRAASGSTSNLLYSTISGTDVTAANGSGLWTVEMNGVVRLAARVGEEVVRDSGVRFATLYDGRSTPVINANNVYAFTANLAGADTRSTLFRVRNSVRTRLVSRGDAVPEVGAGVTFASLVPSWAVQNIAMADDADGSVALLATLGGQGVDSTNDRSLWLFGPDGQRMMVARGGAEAAPGVTFVNSWIGTTVRLNGAGQMAMRVQLAGTGVDELNDVAIFRTLNGRVEMVAREGQTFNDRNGTVYHLRGLTSSSMLQFNDLNQLLFFGSVTTDPRESFGASALFRVDRNGNLRMVATNGQRLPLSGGDVTLNSFTVGEAALSNTGDIAMLGILAGVAFPETIMRVRIEDEPSITPPTHVTADFNNSGDVTQQDLFDFLSAYFAGNMSADINRSGELGTQDLFEFLADWFARR